MIKASDLQQYADQTRQRNELELTKTLEPRIVKAAQEGYTTLYIDHYQETYLYRLIASNVAFLNGLGYKLQQHSDGTASISVSWGG